MKKIITTAVAVALVLASVTGCAAKKNKDTVFATSSAEPAASVVAEAQEEQKNPLDSAREKTAESAADLLGTTSQEGRLFYGVKSDLDMGYGNYDAYQVTENTETFVYSTASVAGDTTISVLDTYYVNYQRTPFSDYDITSDDLFASYMTFNDDTVSENIQDAGEYKFMSRVVEDSTAEGGQIEIIAMRMVNDYSFHLIQIVLYNGDQYVDGIKDVLAAEDTANSVSDDAVVDIASYRAFVTESSTAEDSAVE